MSGRYQVVLADPPWRYDDRGCNGAAEGHYQTMTLEKICALPLAKLAAPDAVLFLWATYPMMREALRVIEAWGFTYKSIAFQWVKTYQPKPDGSSQPFFGLGRWTRGNTEPCLLATRGKPKRAANDVGQLLITPGDELLVSPVTRHSAKPPEVRERIVRLMGDVPRIELFARERVQGWAGWGNEYPRDLSPDSKGVTP
jgi:N6-adenosine-specific RNA methylase IME4